MPTSKRSSKRAPTRAPKYARKRVTRTTRAAEPNPHFELRRSKIQGQGAFALRPIKKGTKIIEYTGERISNDEADQRYDDTKMRRHHTFLFTLSSRTIVDGGVGGNEAAYINHSCDPNCEAIIDRSRIWIYAKKNIAEGEELVYDYQYEWQDDYTDEDVKLYVCRCGSPKCRGTILMPKKKSKA
jgi:SET domain-containing protein